MKRSWWYRFTFMLVIVVISVLTILPTAFNYDEDGSYPIKSKINLGLDLQGGLYMVLGIDFNKVYSDEIRGYIKKMEYVLQDEDIKATIGTPDGNEKDDPKYSIVLDSISNLEKAQEKIKSYFPSIVRLTSIKGKELQYGLTKVIKTRIEEQSVSKSIEVIRNRIDEFGVTEPEIISQGSNRIIIQLPGVKDIARAKELIGKTAKLEFKLVNDTVTPSEINDWLEKAKEENIVLTNIVQLEWSDIYFLRTDADFASIEFWYDINHVYTFAKPRSIMGQFDASLLRLMDRLRGLPV